MRGEVLTDETGLKEECDPLGDDQHLRYHVLVRPDQQKRSVRPGYQETDPHVVQDLQDV
jgi:hypothetical protein